MSARVFEFPDTGNHRTVEQALDWARRRGFKEILILGHMDDDNSFAIVSNASMRKKDALWLLEHAKAYVMGQG